MGTRPIPGLLLSMTVPVIGGMLANALYNIIDRIFIGQFIGTDALAAATLYHPFFMTAFAVGSTVAIGSSSLVAISFGRKDNKYAQKTLNTSVNLVLFIMLTFIAVSEIFSMPILIMSGASDAILPMAMQYFDTVTPGLLFGSLAFILATLIRTENQPRFSLCVTVIGAVMNIVMDALFITVFKWGIFGAGLATTLAQLLSVSYAVSFYIRKKSVLKIGKIGRLPDIGIVKKIISIGFSSGLVIFGFGFFSLMMNRTLHKYGGDNAIAIVGIMMGWDSILTLPMIGISDAAQPIYGYNYGAKLFDRIYQTLKCAAIGCVSYGIISTAAVLLFAEYLVMTFTENPIIVKDGAEVLRICYITSIFAGIGVLAASLFQALGMAKTCIFLGLCRTIIIFIPLLMIFPRLWGLTGAWLCIPSVDVGGALFGTTFLYYAVKRLKKEEKDLQMTTN